MFIDLAELKIYLGITGNEYDDLLNQYLDDSWGIIVSEIGDLTEQSKIFQVTQCDFRNYEIALQVINIKALQEIDGTTYAGVLKTDYRILPPMNGRLWIQDWATYLTTCTKYFDIKVLAGYGPLEVPNDLIYLQKKICGLMWNAKDGKELKSYKLGPRSFTFSDSDQSIENVLSINSTFAKYSILPPV